MARLTQDRIDAAARMLRNGCTRTEICTKLKIGHYTVTQIARELGASGHGAPRVVLHGSRRKAMERCPGCGGMVLMPCMRCLVASGRKPKKSQPETAAKSATGKHTDAAPGSEEKLRILRERAERHASLFVEGDAEYCQPHEYTIPVVTRCRSVTKTVGDI